VCRDARPLRRLQRREEALLVRVPAARVTVERERTLARPDRVERPCRVALHVQLDLWNVAAERTVDIAPMFSRIVPVQSLEEAAEPGDLVHVRRPPRPSCRRVTLLEPA